MAKDCDAQTFVRAIVGGRRYSRGPTDIVAPSAPVLANPIANTTFIDVAWTIGTDGQTGILDTLLEYSLSGAASWTQIIVPYLSGEAPSSSHQITGLSAGTVYDIRVANRDNASIPNVSAYSAIKTATTLGTSADVQPGVISVNVASITVAEGSAFGVELVRTGGGVSSPIVQAQWQFAEFIQGTPTPSNGTIEWASAENGPKSVAAVAGSVTANRSGTFRIASVVALSGSLQPTLGTATAPVTINNVTATAGIKFHPGHYINVGNNNNTASPSNTWLDEIETLNINSGGDVQGVMLVLMWGQLNTGNGVYDWSIVDDTLARCQARGLRLMLRVQDRTFGVNAGTPYVVPADMAGNAAYNGGYFNKQSTSGGGSTGRIAKVWVPSVHTRWMQFVTQVAARYDSHPYFECFRGEETARGITGVFPPEPNWIADYTESNLAFVRDAPALFPHTTVFISANFIEPRTAMEELHALALQYRCAVGGPDLMPPPHAKTYADEVYLGNRWNGSAWVAGGINYVGQIMYCPEVQGPEMGGKEGGWTCAQFYDYALNTFVQNYMIWARKTFQFAHPAQDLYMDNTGHPDGMVPDIKTFLNAGGHPMNSTPPTYYPVVNTG